MLRSILDIQRQYFFFKMELMLRQWFLCLLIYLSIHSMLNFQLQISSSNKANFTTRVPYLLISTSTYRILEIKRQYSLFKTGLNLPHIVFLCLLISTSNFSILEIQHQFFSLNGANFTQFGLAQQLTTLSRREKNAGCPNIWTHYKEHTVAAGSRRSYT